MHLTVSEKILSIFKNFVIGGRKRNKFSLSEIILPFSGNRKLHEEIFSVQLVVCFESVSLGDLIFLFLDLGTLGTKFQVFSYN